ncbi:hypothetical protein CPLU01_01163 [Colletotrichum plurivorum]|uniref:Uncharacterized protein n=1 Tax=Colletotrichum plurivorum TaxID=2175906 RepID=A0A8H6NQ24_9PEZI|nr:hypothetical protein CPLU01_01163 [Colletotrichum plurivorum]
MRAKQRLHVLDVPTGITISTTYRTARPSQMNNRLCPMVTHSRCLSLSLARGGEDDTAVFEDGAPRDKTRDRVSPGPETSGNGNRVNLGLAGEEPQEMAHYIEDTAEWESRAGSDLVASSGGGPGVAPLGRNAFSGPYTMPLGTPLRLTGSVESRPAQGPVFHRVT